MKLEFSEVRFTLTIRQSQSLLEILDRTKYCKYRFDRAQGVTVSDGVKQDCDTIYKELNRLFELNK